MTPTLLLKSLPSFGIISLLALPHALALSPGTNLPAGWSYKNCYTEATNGRALNLAAYTDGSAMTDETCINFCNGKGYNLAGTEYSAECYCGNSLQSGSTTAASTDCSMACSGNSAEACGGPNRLTVFTNGKAPPPAPVNDPGPPGWSFVGCYTDQGTRTLSYGAATNGGGSAMTVANCCTACKAQNYLYAGVEYAGECYCGNTFNGGGGPAPDGLAGCNMPCNGNSSEYCGGPNRLDLYSSGDGPVKMTSATASTAASTGTGSAISSATSSASTSLPPGYSYKGCYVDNANGRILSAQNPDSQTLTVESCVSSCISQGFTVAGMEYGVQCFCGNSVTNGGTLAAQDSDCNVNCPGNSAEKCGAGNRLSIYSNSTIKISAPPASQTSGLPGSWQYQGCITENTTTRVFKYQIILAANNSAQNCLKSCSDFGYMSGGMEYGRECYCGDATDLAAHNSAPAPEADCNIPCTGNASYICGGGNRISYYTWSGTPLYTWHQPQGLMAGAYQFLIGGVVIPLITSAAINGKVTFVEKYGTGPPNSTGAYELDLSQINNFTAAWRPMHVKTDVFCSAGLTLPDKSGRQINIGGWSGDSTYGIRLYTPSGSPGVPGTTDWQENYNELSLQNGRWYPSAMTMANGSILVVGGENGSNGPPVPTLELLPKVGGTVFCDWLNRTDPYNLYPFLVVLPSGGIFVIYYNEARTLDENSFATTKTMPNLPGSVNNFLSGRTYPFEGTQVIMPQHAPYTDPLTVMVCGGSNPGAAVAVDNCVSIQPETNNPQWVLERMPSQRVMSCISALPDGTYLILNGALQGTAGFGLATNPNQGAILYDPSQPVGARFSIMANTPVARLYHSEAILLQDGRVLVSGSDPEDGVHPQEYRNEVFMPPYLLQNKTQPTFNISNKDWTYGQQVSITVKLFQGTTSTMKISMMGAEASTHGNSMGQRTIFPAFSCSGNTCTITAPPDAHTCPPGWFQVFVLDGPTPSHSTYIRIGGDPGQIGNWPNLPDFQPLPGV